MAAVTAVDIVGGGPAGLYVAILLKRSWPSARVRVYEQNAADDTFGFGVVFSDRALDFLRADDPQTHDLITPLMERWRDMTLSLQGETVTLDGIGFAAIARLTLLKILQRRAVDLGVALHFAEALDTLDALHADLIVGADGLNSLVRQSAADRFGAHVEYCENWFAWFGAPIAFETLTQTFVQTDDGAFNAHHYRYAPQRSTFIVECERSSFDACGFATLTEQQSAERCQALFAQTLRGAPLLTNRSVWRRFPRLWCDRWVVDNRVLLGDAAHTAHFSIGSGTRLAMEDAIALVNALREAPAIDAALDAFERTRVPVAKTIVDAANTSAHWYDHFAEKMRLAPLDFAFDYLQRSGRVDLERLRRLSPRFVARYTAARR